jgi:hypothetical protein
VLQLSLAKAWGEGQRIDALLAAQERRIRSAFVTFIANVNYRPVLAEIKQCMKVGDQHGAFKVVDTHIVAMARVIPQAFVSVATDETKALNAKMGFVVKARGPRFHVALAFDASNPRAAALMRQAQLKFIQQLSDTQRAAVRRALATTYSNGVATSSRDFTRAFIDSIGLTDKQVAVVNNYRKLLETNSADALARELRDRRFDRSINTALTSGEPLETTQIDNMVDRYRSNMLSMRADTIARTEGLAAVNQARQESWDQLIDQAGFDRSEVKRTWHATQDNRTRDSHFSMDGQTVGMDEPFETPGGEELMFPGDPSASAAERINCRCTVTVDF